MLSLKGGHEHVSLHQFSKKSFLYLTAECDYAWQRFEIHGEPLFMRLGRRHGLDHHAS